MCECVCVREREREKREREIEKETHRCHRERFYSRMFIHGVVDIAHVSDHRVSGHSGRIAGNWELAPHDSVDNGSNLK